MAPLFKRMPSPGQARRLVCERPLLGAGLAAIVLLAGCGGDTKPVPVFKPFSYGYLTPLRLNVGQIRIEDHVPPATGPADLAPTAPVSPDDALRQMAQDRLVAAGSSGTAVLTIDQASITGQAGSALDGTLAVHLDIVSNTGGHTGYAEAHVSREFVPGSGTDNDGLKSQLYGLTSQMMQDMNVEFEFQLRRTLGDWMLDASGAPVSGSVEQQPLAGPDGAPASPPPPAGADATGAGAQAPASVGAPVQLAPPATAVPSDAVPVQAAPPAAGAPDAGAAAPAAADPGTGPLPLSPPPGVLQAPPGATPVPPALPYKGQYPTPPGYAPSGAASGSPTPDGTAQTPPEGNATPGGY